MSAWGNRRLRIDPRMLSALKKGEATLEVPEHVLKEQIADIKRPTRMLEEYEIEEIFKLLSSGERPDRTKYGITSWEMDELIEHFNAAQRNEIYVGTDPSN